MPISEQEAAQVEEHLAPARDRAGQREWAAGLAAGRALTREEALESLRAFAAT